MLLWSLAVTITLVEKILVNEAEKGWEDFDELWELWKSQAFLYFEDAFL